MNEKPIRHITLIGFGEFGGIFATDLTAAGLHVSVFDILLDSEPSRTPMLLKAKAAKVRACDTLREAIHDADLVISAVTCSAAIEVARNAAPFLRKGQIYLDINSVSPETKREIAGVLKASPAIFIEAAVMAPVAPQRIKVPMLLGGRDARNATDRLKAIGLNLTHVSDEIGVASATKMCRSIVIKGLESLAVESLFTARRYHAEKEVLASLAATFPGMGWDASLPDYLISRVAEHGKRRAAEMREAAQAIADVGLEPLTALATAERQDWLVQAMKERRIAFTTVQPFSWRQLADDLAGKIGGEIAKENKSSPLPRRKPHTKKKPPQRARKRPHAT
jgi:3-hydroxyisobutyrate dehydrogenase-like beta-hydroxyacid dehydrogenase